MLIPKLTTNLFTEADTDGTQGSSVNQFWIFVNQELLKVEINPSSGAVVIMNTMLTCNHTTASNIIKLSLQL